MNARTLIGGLVAAGTATLASAGTSYGFGGVTVNDVNDTQIAESQMMVEVSDLGGSAAFEFTNAGPEASSIVQIYWDDNLGVLDALTGWSTTSGSGVDYSGGGAAPPNLPGGNPIGFNADYSIEPKSQGGKSQNGVGVGEDVTVNFSLLGSYADLISALNSGDLKIGIHVQAFESGGSESLTTTIIPTPSAALAGAALLGIVGLRRRR